MQGQEPRAEGQGEKLPVHGFVLAGGKSSRMGEDKALLKFRGRPMVEIAVEKLRGFCTEVSIAGNREDLGEFAPVVREERVDCGPAAGIEAGLKASKEEWAMFVPVDVPLVPGELLQRWAGDTVKFLPEFETTSGSLLGSSLYTRHGGEPVFAMLRPEVVRIFSQALDSGVRRMNEILYRIRSEYGHTRYLRVDAEWFAGGLNGEIVELLFKNLNTPEELTEAEAFVQGQ